MRWKTLLMFLQWEFLSFSTVRCLLISQATNSEYALLEMMNLRAATEYDNQADFAAGLRVFVGILKQKNNSFSDYLQQIDEIDQEVTELEALVSTLDNYTSNLEAKIKDSSGDHRRLV